MGLESSELEKVRLAKEWVDTQPRGSQEWYAAYEHLVWVAQNTQDTGIRTECRAILEKVLAKPLPKIRNSK